MDDVTLGYVTESLSRAEDLVDLRDTLEDLCDKGPYDDEDHSYIECQEELWMLDLEGAIPKFAERDDRCVPGEYCYSWDKDSALMGHVETGFFIVPLEPTAYQIARLVSQVKQDQLED